MFLLDHLLDAAEQIRAEERLQFIQDIAAGSGTMRKTYLQSHLRQLRRRVTPPRDATYADLAQAGIEVVKQ